MTGGQSAVRMNGAGETVTAVGGSQECAVIDTGYGHLGVYGRVQTRL